MPTQQCPVDLYTCLRIFLSYGLFSTMWKLLLLTRIVVSHMLKVLFIRHVVMPFDKVRHNLYFDV
jgi:hypothetical protein